MMNNLSPCYAQTSSRQLLKHTKCPSTSRSRSCVCTDHKYIRSHLSITGRVRLKRRLRARAPLEHVLDGGSLWGGPCPGINCCDWRPTCRLQRTQCLSDPRHPHPAAQSAASVFIYCHITDSNLQIIDL